MFEILHIEAEPVLELRYLNAVRGGGTESLRLRFERARVSGLPDDLDALVATSDLQGIVPDPQTREVRLLGLAVAEALEALSFDDTLPAPMRTGVLLAGDLYSVPAANKRGGFGDVAEVWAAFAARFKWVAGVAGNHDDVRTLRPADNLHLLDTDAVMLDTLRIGGVGLIAGNPDKVGRRAEVDQLERIELVASEGLDVLVLHEGPEGDRLQPGNPLIRALVVSQSVPLTVCGHAHWGAPLFRLPRGQVLNVDARVVVMTR